MLTGIVVLLSYYVVVWARTVRKQLQRFNESAGLLQSRWFGLENDVGALTRELASKVSAADVERCCAAFVLLAPRKAKSKMVMKRG